MDHTIRAAKEMERRIKKAQKQGEWATELWQVSEQCYPFLGENTFDMPAGYRYEGKCDVKTRIQRRREEKKTERRHELGLDRRIRN